jgi:hypothetical protein
MTSRSMTVAIWSCYLALGLANLAQHHYWFGVAWLALSVIWFVRGMKAANLDELNATTLGLNPRPRPRSIFSVK